MKKHIPNAITCCNLISGCIAIVMAICGNYEGALWAIIIGAVFDFFDGMSARLLGVSSPIGKELDSLADVVTFGVAPSAMLFSAMMSINGMYILSDKIVILGMEEGLLTDIVEFSIAAMPFLAFLMAAFSALRLAKFNLDERQAMGFIGLPTPANALFWGSLIVGWGNKLAPIPAIVPLLLVLMLVSCYLLVSEIPMFALKFKTWGWQGNEVKWLFLASCVPLLLIFGIGALAIIIAWYIVLSVITQRHVAK
ncbi:MAG: CDP-alcohol phosphatidyltransferase family protein [Prevotella sp.]|nr:CDP-alcohol phosphatidyltransferase family protein [Prevotella sp.]